MAGRRGQKSNAGLIAAAGLLCAVIGAAQQAEDRDREGAETTESDLGGLS